MDRGKRSILAPADEAGTGVGVLPRPKPARRKVLAARVRCPDCENFLCNIHGSHAHDCDCPELEVWDLAGIDPYSQGGHLLPEAVAALTAE